MDNLIELKLSRGRLFLLESELLGLLKTDMTLWERAVMRGKAIQRTRQAQCREPKIKDNQAGQGLGFILP